MWEGAPNQHVVVSMVHPAHDLLLASSLARQCLMTVISQGMVDVRADSET